MGYAATGSHSEWPMLPPEAMVMSGSMLPLRVMCGLMVLLWLWSVLMSMAHVATKGHVDVCGQCCRLTSCLQVSIYAATLRPFWCPWSVMPPRALSRSAVLLWPGAVFVVCAVTRSDMIHVPTDCEELGYYFCCEGGTWKASVTNITSQPPLKVLHRQEAIKEKA